MSSNRQWYIVFYDVRDDTRLRRVARLLKGYGVRIQYSVFRCRLSKKELSRLKWELTKIMDHADDLLIVGVCENCADKIISEGDPKQWSNTELTYDII